jgi:hypothetical protein
MTPGDSGYLWPHTLLSHRVVKRAPVVIGGCGPSLNEIEHPQDPVAGLGRCIVRRRAQGVQRRFVPRVEVRGYQLFLTVEVVIAAIGAYLFRFKSIRAGLVSRRAYECAHKICLAALEEVFLYGFVIAKDSRYYIPRSASCEAEKNMAPQKIKSSTFPTNASNFLVAQARCCCRVRQP